MRRNSIEKRSAFTEKSYVDGSRCNPESATSIVVSPNLQEKYKKNLESSASIRNLAIDANSLENRFENLQKLYKGVLAKIGVQNQCVFDQAKQIKRLESLHENNQKQIRRLRGMLGFLQKEDKQTQTKSNGRSQPLSSTGQNMNIKSCINLSKFSNHSSKDNSKIIKAFNSTGYDVQTSLMGPSNHKSVPKSTNLRVSRNGKYVFNEQQHTTNSDFYNKKQDRCKSPNGLIQKFKFVPSLLLA